VSDHEAKVLELGFARRRAAALIERVPDLAGHIHRTVKARLADTEQARKGDLAAGEIAQAAHTDKSAEE
jgi:hypothetical protein